MPNKIQDSNPRIEKNFAETNKRRSTSQETKKNEQRKYVPTQKNTKKKQMIFTKEKIKIKHKQNLPKIKESLIQINIILIEIKMQEIINPILMQIKANINKKQKKLKKLNFPRKTIIYSMIQIIAQFMVIMVKEIKLM